MNHSAPPERVVFMGTPPLAREALKAIVEAGYRVALVLTQPDRPKGRGKKPQPGPVKELALELGLEVFQPVSLKSEEARAVVARAAPDVAVVAAYGLILPAAVLAIPRLGCLNIHTSILPRWRGAAPIQRAIEAGDERTGVSIMQMDEGLDTGDVLFESFVDIAPGQTAGELSERLAREGAALMLKALADPASWRPKKQSDEGVTYAKKIMKEEGAIDWSLPAAVIERRVRAFNPAPGCYCFFEGKRLKVHLARVASSESAAFVDGGIEPGLVASVGPGVLGIATGDGVLELLRVQPEGARRMDVQDFLAGRKVEPGASFRIAGEDA